MDKNEIFSRTALLLGDENLKILRKKTVVVCGLGGVGSYAAESLARTGIGTLVLIDFDTVEPSNINRQLFALHSTLKIYKTEAAKKRLLDINPELSVRTFITRLGAPTDEALFKEADFIIDAIDNVTAKIALICFAHEKCIPIISAMGCGNHTDITKLEISDIYNTSVCPLCRVMRHELRQRGIPGHTVVFSTEKQFADIIPDENAAKIIPSTVFVPAAAGLLMGQYTVNTLLKMSGENK